MNEQQKIEANNKPVIDTTPKGAPAAAPAAPKKPLKIDDSEGIPVLELRAKDPQGIPLGAKNYQQVNSGKPKMAGTDQFEITYLPRFQHHRVRVIYGDAAKPARTFFVPREWVCWEAAE